MVERCPICGDVLWGVYTDCRCQSRRPHEDLAKYSYEELKAELDRRDGHLINEWRGLCDTYDNVCARMAAFKEKHPTIVNRKSNNG